MHIVIAPGSYKGTLKSIEAVKTIAAAIPADTPGLTVEELVLADGGEGTLEAFRSLFGGRVESCPVRSPLGAGIQAGLLFMENNTAVVETAQAIGLSLLAPDQRDPFGTSSRGVGELITHATGRGATRVLVTMGDSATMDMGIGMLSSLGVRFYTRSGEISAPSLRHLAHIVDFDDTALEPLRAKVQFLGLADTDDYLCGDTGQVRLFGAQKGLLPSHVQGVELAYINFAKVIQRRLGPNVLAVVRSSGSGGLGAALHAFLHAKLVNTLDYLSRVTPMDDVIRRADVVITGEGCLDRQTCLGKVPHFVARRASRLCVAIVGSHTCEGLADFQAACRGAAVVCLNPNLALTEPRRALFEAMSSVMALLRA